MLILHFIGLAMGLGTSFAHAFLGNTLSKLESSEAAKFRLQLKGLSRMGTTGTILLLVSGIYLLLPYWPALSEMPMLILKLVLFLVLVLLIFLLGQGARNNFENDTQSNLNRMAVLGKLTLLVSVVIVIVAVNIFH